MIEVCSPLQGTIVRVASVGTTLRAGAEVVSFAAAPPPSLRPGKKRPHIDTW